MPDEPTEETTEQDIPEETPITDVFDIVNLDLNPPEPREWPEPDEDQGPNEFDEDGNPVEEEEPADDDTSDEPEAGAESDEALEGATGGDEDEDEEPSEEEAEEEEPLPAAAEAPSPELARLQQELAEAKGQINTLIATTGKQEGAAPEEEATEEQFSRVFNFNTPSELVGNIMSGDEAAVKTTLDALLTATAEAVRVQVIREYDQRVESRLDRYTNDQSQAREIAETNQNSIKTYYNENPAHSQAARPQIVQLVAQQMVAENADLLNQGFTVEVRNELAARVNQTLGLEATTPAPKTKDEPASGKSTGKEAPAKVSPTKKRTRPPKQVRAGARSASTPAKGTTLADEVGELLGLQ